MKLFLYISLLVTSIAALSACATAQKQSMNTNPNKAVTGITGKVTWLEGNQMPSVGIGNQPSKKSNVQGVQRTLWVYQATGLSQTKRIEGAFFAEITTPLVKRFRTNSDGTFTIALPPGSYSVFSEEEKGLYANRFDGQGNIFVVEVKEGELTEIEILLDYMAAY